MPLAVWISEWFVGLSFGFLLWRRENVPFITCKEAQRHHIQSFDFIVVSGMDVFASSIGEHSLKKCVVHVRTGTLYMVELFGECPSFVSCMMFLILCPVRA